LNKRLDLEHKLNLVTWGESPPKDLLKQIASNKPLSANLKLWKAWLIM